MSETLDETIDAPEAEAEAGAELEPEARAEPEAEATAPTPAPAEVDWNNVENLRAAAARLQEMGYTIGQAPEPAPPETPTFVDEYGNVDPAALAQFIAQQIGAQTTPLEQFVAEQQQQQVDGKINDLLGRVATEAKLEGVDTSRLRAVADSFAVEAGQKYGQTPQAAEYAARQAADWLAHERKTAGEAAVRAYQESIGQVAAAPGEPSGAGGGLRMEPKPSSYDEIIAKYEGRIATA